MTVAAAIAAATGLDPSRDFYVVDDGKGAPTLKWDEVKLGPRPTPQQIEQFQATYDAKAPDRTLAAFIMSIRNEYTEAMIKNDLFQDSKALDALIAKVAAFKSANPQAMLK